MTIPAGSRAFSRRIRTEFVRAIRNASAASIAVVVSAHVASAQWTVTKLDPAGSTISNAFGTSGGQQVGFATVGGVDRASMWSGTAASWVDLHPAGSDFSFAWGTDGAQQVGFAAFQGGLVGHASLWSGTAASWVDLQPAGASYSDALGVAAGQQVGFADFGSTRRAGLWSGTAASWVDLGPSGSPLSEAKGTSGTTQVGYAQFGSTQRACLWSGTASSRVDLHPSGATSSTATGVSGNQQVGVATIGNVGRAGLWSGTAASWLDLHPTGATVSLALGTDGAHQVGCAEVGLRDRACLWSGTAASWEDLSLALPSSWRWTRATSVWNDGALLYVAGIGFNEASGHEEALLWSRPLAGPAAYCSAKTNSQGCVPTIASSGVPSASAGSGFVVSASNVLNHTTGILFYGKAQATAPFQGGTLCVATPVRRAGMRLSAGNPPPDDCSGVLALDFNAYVRNGADPALVVGAFVNAQWWYRDPSSPSTTGLSDALRFEIGP